MTPPRRWRHRDSAASLALLLALLLAAMAMAGIGHQVRWLASAGEPLTRSSWDTVEVSGRHICSNLRSLRSAAFPLRELPVGHEIFHVVPIDLTGGAAEAVLIFPRDGEELARRGGLLCRAGGGEERLGPPDVAARLAALRAPAAR